MAKGTVTLNEGDVFGRLKALHQTRKTYWLCKCICGNTTEVPRHRLASGNTKSCGCLKKSVLGESKLKHGMANSRVTGYKNRAYGVWQAMKDRCTNPNRKDFKYYGGRNISFCKEWQSFEQFYKDMGEPPEGASLDRIDNSNDYTPANCRWASRSEQISNSRKALKIEINGEVKTLKAWLAVYGVSATVYYRRRKKGWSEVDSIVNVK